MSTFGDMFNPTFGGPKKKKPSVDTSPDPSYFGDIHSYRVHAPMMAASNPPPMAATGPAATQTVMRQHHPMAPINGPAPSQQAPITHDHYTAKPLPNSKPQNAPPQSPKKTSYQLLMERNRREHGTAG